MVLKIDNKDHIFLPEHKEKSAIFRYLSALMPYL